MLLDNTVRHHAVTHESAWISTGTKKWGPHDVPTGYLARIPVRSLDDTSEDHHNVKYLPGLLSLAQSGKIQFLTSEGLDSERGHQPHSRYAGIGLYDNDLFGSIHIARVDNGNIFRTPTVEHFRNTIALDSDPLYRGLVTVLGVSHSQDAWHIYTAEKHSLFCFLTMDYKLYRHFKANSHREPIKSLRTQLLTPAQLGRDLKLTPVPLNLLSYHGASYPVRPDLHWQNQKRRPSRTKPKTK